ncbi:hypothetical protein OKW41_002921 [Paraburkholderia sp. UCT70]
MRKVPGGFDTAQESRQNATMLCELITSGSRSPVVQGKSRLNYRFDNSVRLSKA